MYQRVISSHRPSTLLARLRTDEDVRSSKPNVKYGKNGAGFTAGFEFLDLYSHRVYMRFNLYRKGFLHSEDKYMIGGFGIWELLIILLIVLVIFGAKKLPEIGGGIGKAISNFKKATNEPDEIDVTPKNDDKEKDKE
jgi:sec-independent protein translocase protein TatA